MKIDRVTYRRLVAGDDSSSRAVEASAQVEDGETAPAVLQNLRLWVEGQLAELGNGKSISELREEIEQARESAAYWAKCARREFERTTAVRETMRERYRELGCIDAYAPDCDNVPF